MRYVAVLWAMIAVANVSPGETIHVSPEGNDKNPGTTAEPIRTLTHLRKVLSRRAEVTEVVIHGGTYPGDLVVNVPQGADPKALPVLTIRAAKDEEVIFDGARRITEAAPVKGAPGLFRIAGRYALTYPAEVWEADTRTRYIAVADLRTVREVAGTFTFDEKTLTFHTTDGKGPGAHDIAMSDRNVGIEVARPNVVIEGITFRSFLFRRWSSGVDIRAANGVVRNCRAWNCVRGFQASHYSSDSRIENCRTDDCAGGIYMSGKNVDVIDCRCFKVRDAFMIPIYAQDDTGIQYYSPANGGTVRGNLVKGFRNGIFLKCGGVYTVEHNTVIDGVWGLYRSGWGKGNVYRRNIIVGFDWPTYLVRNKELGCIVEDNCIWDLGSKAGAEETLAVKVETPGGGPNVMVDPQFATAAAGDYRLLPAGPCVARAKGGRPWGALGVVGDDFKDTHPPVVRLEFAAPAVHAPVPAEGYVGEDPWQPERAGAPRTLKCAAVDADFLTGGREVTLRIHAKDAASDLGRMRIKEGRGRWRAEEPYAPDKRFTLKDMDGVHLFAVRVSDALGNWSEPVVVRVCLLRTRPAIVGRPVARTSTHGALVNFRTSRPVSARLECGPDAAMGKSVDVLQSISDRPSEADFTAMSRWMNAHVQYHAALPTSSVKAGGTYHYRLKLADAVGNEAVSGDATFRAGAEARVLHVSPQGRDDERSGSRERPFATLQFAADRALPGDRILMQPGIYMTPTTLTRGGAEGAPITIEAEKPGTVAFDGLHKLHTLLLLKNAPHVHLRNLEFRWYGQFGVRLDHSPHARITGCKAWNAYGHGWTTGHAVSGWYSPHLVAERNLFMWQEYGINMWHSPHLRIRHNTAYNNMYAGVLLVYSNGGSVVRNNSLTFNGLSQVTYDALDQTERDALDSDYNNFGTTLRKEPGPADSIVAKPPSYGPKAKMVVNFYYEQGGTEQHRFRTLQGWRDFAGKDAHSIVADPLYVNPPKHDFRIQPGSPNIGAGEGGATIGAFGVAE